MAKERLPGALTLTEDDRRVLAVWAADCAERTLALFEVHAPDDPRPRAAIDGARAFARGELRIGVLLSLAAQAHAAARAMEHPAASAAARAAGHVGLTGVVLGQPGDDARLDPHRFLAIASAT